MSRLKAVWARVKRWLPVRAWNRFGKARGDRQAAATTLYAFTSMFPLLALAASIVAGLASDQAVLDLKAAISSNLPGIADKIGLDQIIDNSGSIGLVSAVALLFTGLGWIDSLRASLRLMWGLDDQPGNAITRKLTDAAVLIGLGFVASLATVSTSLLGQLSARFASWVGLDGTWMESWGLKLFGYGLGVFTGTLLYAYILAVVPRIRMPKLVLLAVSLLGGVIFVLAQALGGLYINRVIGRNAAYGALALPLALLVWIYLLTRIMMLLEALAREATVDRRAARMASAEVDPDVVPALELDPGAGVPATPTTKQTDSVTAAAGAVLGSAATLGAVWVARALKALRRR